MTTDDVRARFEAWLLRLGYTSRPERRPSGKYVNGQIQGNWLAWQAAHADLSVEVRELVEAATELRQRQRDYLSGPKEQRSEEKGRLVGVAAARVDAALAKFTQEKP